MSQQSQEIHGLDHTESQLKSKIEGLERDFIGERISFDELYNMIFSWQLSDEKEEEIRSAN